MIRSKFIISVLLMPVAFLTSTNCMAQTQQANSVACPIDSTAKAIYKGETSMAYSLFEQVDKQHDKNENVVISPLCLADALTILANGAKGITLDQIASVLGTEDLNTEKVSEVYGKLNDYLAGYAREVGIKTANSVQAMNWREHPPEHYLWQVYLRQINFRQLSVYLWYLNEGLF